MGCGARGGFKKGGVGCLSLTDWLDKLTMVSWGRGPKQSGSGVRVG